MPVPQTPASCNNPDCKYCGKAADPLVLYCQACDNQTTSAGLWEFILNLGKVHVPITSQAEYCWNCGLPVVNVVYPPPVYGAPTEPGTSST